MSDKRRNRTERRSTLEEGLVGIRGEIKPATPEPTPQETSEAPPQAHDAGYTLVLSTGPIAGMNPPDAGGEWIVRIPSSQWLEFISPEFAGFLSTCPKQAFELWDCSQLGNTETGDSSVIIGFKATPVTAGDIALLLDNRGLAGFKDQLDTLPAPDEQGEGSSRTFEKVAPSPPPLPVVMGSGFPDKSKGSGLLGHFASGVAGLVLGAAGVYFLGKSREEN